MKKIFALMALLTVLCTAVLPTYAAEGNVTYDGSAGKFIFAPGSNESPTDLFPEFKDVMPGDSLTQRIIVKNAESEKVDVTIYLRALGAHEESEEFLSQLRLRVNQLGDSAAEEIFDAAASETAQLTDWVCLGKVKSGGKVELDVVLDIPVALDNRYSNQIGYLDWEFRVDEIEAPDTGDRTQPVLWGGVMLTSAAALCILLLCRKNRHHA